jgi:sulfur carrier protein
LKLTVNGEPLELPEGATVEYLVECAGPPARDRGIAVAVDSEVVPRSAWNDTVLSEGQRIELLAAMQGG